MLTIKQITENTEEVIRGLEKKHFKDAKATIDQRNQQSFTSRNGQSTGRHDQPALHHSQCSL